MIELGVQPALSAGCSVEWLPTAHTVRVRTVYHDMVRRGAPVPVPEVRAGGPYRGAPRTAGTKGKLHRSLCAPSVGGK